MQSSQALTQSVFGTIDVLCSLQFLASVVSDDGQPAFGPVPTGTRLELEKDIHTLGERPPRTTSVDVWLDGDYRVAVECKLAEREFGTCSRPRRRLENDEYCDGTYTFQKGRTKRCALAEINIEYWLYTAELFGWSPGINHKPCPLNKTYQLARNLLAACVDDGQKLRTGSRHALIIYDDRNPAMAAHGAGGSAWGKIYDALRDRSILRRLSWQRFMSQWPNDQRLNWLKKEVYAKYGLLPSTEL